MNATKKTQQINKFVYKTPTFEMICFQPYDIVTASGKENDNLGEWDPQYTQYSIK